MSAVYFLLLVLPLISAQFHGQGHCPEPHVQQDFNIHAFLGTWYEVANIPSHVNQGKCAMAEHISPKGTYIVARHSQYINGKYSYKIAVISPEHASEPAKLQIQFSKDATPLPYWVLYTDYDTYAVVYTCVNNVKTNSHFQYIWIIARQPYVDKHALEIIKHELLRQGINGNVIKKTDQSCYQKAHDKD